MAFLHNFEPSGLVFSPTDAILFRSVRLKGKARLLCHRGYFGITPWLATHVDGVLVPQGEGHVAPLRDAHRAEVEPTFEYLGVMVNNLQSDSSDIQRVIIELQDD